MTNEPREPRSTDDAGRPGATPARYAHVLAWVAETPWAVLPSVLAVINDLLAYRAAGHRLDRSEVLARIGAAPPSRPARARAGAVAVLPLTGLIAHRASAFEDVSAPPGTSVQRFTVRFREALADPDVAAILIDVDSPGGAVDGVAELAAEIAAARGRKPIVAVANTLAASAAYWIATQADELVVSPSAEVGSIGVFAAHQEFSRMDERIGVTTTLISAGKFKTEANPYEPLTDEARAAIQARVDDYYRMFVDAVARGRGVTAAAVRSGFGEGRVVGARDAVGLGMADRVATFDETLARLRAGRRPRRRRATARHRFSFA